MRVLLLALVFSLTGVFLGRSDDTVRAGPVARPDIVLFLIDDTAPHPKRLWNDPERTPNINAFLERGVEFRHAIATTPLCGPSRANLLTGKHGHKSGMTGQELADLKAVMQVQQRMRVAGYRTGFIGKYINGLWDLYPTAGQVKRAARGWDHFDVIWKSKTKIYEWRQWSRSGTRTYGDRGRDHSSYVAATRAARHIRKAPSDKPLFMIISLIDGHKPLLPMKRFEDHHACRDIGVWDGPAYDEADVSDKPAYIRARPRIGDHGYDLTARCEVAMTTDWVIGTVNKALKERKKYRNTLSLLVADNGMGMGDHRHFAKSTPYATRIPMYARWPARIGNHRRIVRDPVAIIDLPRTFCALAACKMPRQDGRNILPLLNGNQTQTVRKFIFTEMLRGAKGYGTDPTARPAWSGVDTTLGYDDTLWSYARYQTGEEELYDLANDPHRLRNLAGRASAADVLADVRRMWRKVWEAEGVSWRTPFRR